MSDNELITNPEASGCDANAETEQLPVYRPKVRIWETDREIVIQTELPGVNESNVEVTFDRKVLTLVGTADPGQFDGYRLSYREFGLGRFERAFTIHEEIDRDSIEAQLRDGLLTVTLHKIVPEKTKVTVKAG